MRPAASTKGPSAPSSWRSTGRAVAIEYLGEPGVGHAAVLREAQTLFL
jgi:hypothetical protein